MFDAERRLGEILREWEIGPGRPSAEIIACGDNLGLRDIGLTIHQSSRYQTLADIPDDELDRAIQQYQQSGRPSTTSGIVKKWKEQQKRIAINGTPLHFSVNQGGGLTVQH